MYFQPSEPHHHHHLHALTNSAGKTAAGLAGVGVILAIAAVPTFVIGPFMVGAFKPEWSYGRRLAASFAFSTIVGATVGIVRAASGADKQAAPATTPASAVPATAAGVVKNAVQNGWSCSPASIDARARRIAYATNTAPFRPSLPMR